MVTINLVKIFLVFMKGLSLVIVMYNEILMNSAKISLWLPAEVRESVFCCITGEMPLFVPCPRERGVNANITKILTLIISLISLEY